MFILGLKMKSIFFRKYLISKSLIEISDIKSLEDKFLISEIYL